MREKVEAESDRIGQQGIIEPVQFFDCPIVPVLKQDGSVRICGDFVNEVNCHEVAELDTYPLPYIDNLFASLSGGKYFSKLDLARAYLQLPLDEASRKYYVRNY